MSSPRSTLFPPSWQFYYHTINHLIIYCIIPKQVYVMWYKYWPLLLLVLIVVSCHGKFMSDVKYRWMRMRTDFGNLRMFPVDCLFSYAGPYIPIPCVCSWKCNWGKHVVVQTMHTYHHRHHQMWITVTDTIPWIETYLTNIM